MQSGCWANLSETNQTRLTVNRSRAGSAGGLVRRRFLTTRLNPCRRTRPPALPFCRAGLLACAFCVGLWGSPDVLQRAAVLYQHTDYAASLRALAEDPAPDAASYLLRGKNYFMSGDYKKAVEFFEKSLSLSPGSSESELWLGRAWGRRAETGNWMTAPSSASRARQCFEKAIALDPHNNEARNDLFAYYLNAPGLMGGGVDKAEAAAKSIASERPAEYEFEEGQLAEKRKDFKAAEAHLRRA